MRKTNPYRQLEKRLGYRFRDKTLLEAALTHRSFTFESSEADTDNQRLEFLGDAVLDLLVAAYLFEEFEEPEGVLTSYRSQTTSGKALAAVGNDLEVGTFLRMGKGEETSGGRLRPSALADAVEAILGAAYMDGGMRAATKIFATVFRPRLKDLPGDIWKGNPKGRLQELCQRHWKISPAYRVVTTEGPPHDVTFTVEVRVNDEVRGAGRGPNKQAAERAAAREALAHMDTADPAFTH